MDRDPEDARALLDSVVQLMMDAVHRYEGTVNQVMGDGIMALFGAPLAHEDHAVRACFAALAIQSRSDGELGGAFGSRLRGRGAHWPQLGRRHRADDRERSSEWTIPPWVSRRFSPPAWSNSLRRHHLAVAETRRLAEGFVGVRPLGLLRVKGLAEPCCPSSSSARAHRALAGRRGSYAGSRVRRP